MHANRGSVFVFNLWFLVLLSSCTQSTSSPTPAPTFAPKTEPSYCSTTTSYSGGVTVTATATYQYRNVSVAGLGSVSTANIRYAEVQVLNQSGSVVQCGTTDGSGSISVIVPSGAATYTLKVLSRADNNFLKASVLNSPSENEPYSISEVFSVLSSDTSVSVSLDPAPYTNSLEGGAFNILDQVYKSNEYLRNNSNSASWCSGVCTQFTVAPKVAIYWIPGFNPRSYTGSSTVGLSFYLSADSYTYSMLKGIYILGGLYGDYNCQDTDHFDNSVIIHEYAHYLEDAYSKLDSPGGAHNGNAIIDPRLAWSEGWANFFQSAVLSSRFYRDTIGNSACSGGTALAVNLDLETQNIDIPAATPLGEGVFREISVSRMLWETIDNGTAGDGVNGGFSAVWKAFSDSSLGMASSNVRFRNVGKFNQIITELFAIYDPSKSSDFASLLSSEKQYADQTEYAEIRTAQSSSSCQKTITGSNNVSSPSGGTTSDLLRSNDFFSYYYNGTDNITLTLRYSAASGTPSDLDLYVYKEDHSLGSSSSLIAISANNYPEATPGQESVSLTGKPAGYYLVNVQVNVAQINNAANYYIEFSPGVRLCL